MESARCQLFAIIAAIAVLSPATALASSATDRKNIKKSAANKASSPHLQKARQYAQQNHLKEALAKYSQEVQIHPKDDSSLSERAEVNWRLGDRDSALADSNEALRLAPLNYDYLMQNSRYLILTDQQWDQTLRNSNVALKQKPKSVLALYYKAQGLSGTGKVAEALPLFSKAINSITPQDPLWGHILMSRAFGFRSLKQWKNSVADWKLYLSHNVGSDETWYRLAEVSYQLKQFDQALASIDKSIALNGSRDDAFILKARTLQALKKDSEVIAACTAALKANPKLWEAYKVRANSHKVLGHYSQQLKDVCSSQLK